MNRSVGQADGKSDFRSVELGQPKTVACSNTGYPNSNGIQSISVYANNGRPASGPLDRHDIAFDQGVLVVGIPLHHGRALGQVLGLVVDTGHAFLDVR